VCEWRVPTPSRGVCKQFLGPELDLHGGFTTNPTKTPVAGTPLAGLLVNGAATAATLSGGTGSFPVALAKELGKFNSNDESVQQAFWETEKRAVYETWQRSFTQSDRA
jgi:hypothetical protein